MLLSAFLVFAATVSDAGAPFWTAKAAAEATLRAGDATAALAQYDGLLALLNAAVAPLEGDMRFVQPDDGTYAAEPNVALMILPLRQHRCQG